MARTPGPAKLPDLDPAVGRWLSGIGVRTCRDLARLGAVEAYRQLKARGRPLRLEFLYALEGALRGIAPARLPHALRNELKARAAEALKPRCRWCGRDPLYRRYHDEEWGVPVHDDRRLFEFLILEGAQAGLSWLTILRKREAYREAFAGFDPRRVARIDGRRRRALMHNPGIVRNRLKIESAVTNARAFLAVQKEFGSFDRYLWAFVGGRPIVNRWNPADAVPARTAESDALSRDLQRRGFRFVGSTIMYAFMQAVGMVNDHTTDCFRYRPLARRSSRT